MAKWHAIFYKLKHFSCSDSDLFRSCGGERRRRHDRFFFRERFPLFADAACLFAGIVSSGWPVTVSHQILLFRCAPGQNPEPGWDSSRVGSLQLQWKLADQILDLFCFVSVTDQKRVLSSHNNEIMNSKQCDGRSVLLENDCYCWNRAQ